MSNYAPFVPIKLRGTNDADCNSLLKMAGKSSIGKGSKNRVIDVKMTDSRADSIDLPKLILPSLFYTSIPSFISLFLMINKLQILEMASVRKLNSV